MHTKTREITFCAMFAALIMVGAFIKLDIPLPIYTMHFTLQWLFVQMAAMLLGKKTGTISVIIYILVGLSGIPVFAAGGGPSYVFRPGFGFLLGFVLAAWIIGKLCELLPERRLKWLLFPATAGLFAYYGVGAVYFYLIRNLYAGDAVAFSVVVVQYCLITVLPDFLLCVMASLLAEKLWPVFR